MFYSRQLNKKINKIQERALRITYKDVESTYSELLEKGYAVTIHTRNLQLPMTGMYKTKSGLSPSFIIMIQNLYSAPILMYSAALYNLRFLIMSV